MRIPALLIALILVLTAILAAGCTSTVPVPQNQSVTTPTPTPTPAPAPVPTAEDLVAFVERAFEYAEENGRDAALAEFNNPTGRFVDGELYIFAYDANGTTLALPFQPAIIGTNRWNTT
ncbi:MAG TPA: cache domain-containing protein, partial [Methanomicrobiales archaeon]|nr:cache domain-containing protein [Methanomicrobiales archaeon]